MASTTKRPMQVASKVGARRSLACKIFILGEQNRGGCVSSCDFQEASTTERRGWRFDPTRQTHLCLSSRNNVWPQTQGSIHTGDSYSSIDQTYCPLASQNESATKSVQPRYNAQLKLPSQNYARHHVLRGLQLCQPTFTYERFYRHSTSPGNS